MIVGDKSTNRVLRIKKTNFNARTQGELSFEPNAETRLYTVYALCDSYLGCDQAEELNLG